MYVAVGSSVAELSRRVKRAAANAVAAVALVVHHHRQRDVVRPLIGDGLDLIEQGRVLVDVHVRRLTQHVLAVVQQIGGQVGRGDPLELLGLLARPGVSPKAPEMLRDPQPAAVEVLDGPAKVGGQQRAVERLCEHLADLLLEGQLPHDLINNSVLVVHHPLRSFEAPRRRVAEIVVLRYRDCGPIPQERFRKANGWVGVRVAATVVFFSVVSTASTRYDGLWNARGAQ